MRITCSGSAVIPPLKTRGENGIAAHGNKSSATRLRAIVLLVGLAALAIFAAIVLVAVVVVFEASWIIAAVGAPLLALLALIFVIAAACLLLGRKVSRTNNNQFSPHDTELVVIKGQKKRTKVGGRTY